MDYRYNIDHRDCNREGGLSYNQILDIVDVEGSDNVPEEPVTLEEAKNFCKIDIDEDNDLIEALIPAARLMCEEYSNIGFVQRQVICTLNNGNGGCYLPLGPVGDISSVKNLEETDLTYKVGGVAFKQILEPWLDYIQVVYTAGYETLPENLKTAMLNAIMYLYDNRSQGIENIGPIATMLLKPVRRVW